MMTKILSKIELILFLVLIVLVPIQTFGVTILEHLTQMSGRQIFWFNHWYEAVVILLLVVIIGFQLFKKKLRVQLSEIVAIVLLTFGIISVFFLSPTIGRGIEGFRVTLFSIAIFLLAVRSDLSDYDRRLVLKTYLTSAFILALGAILERFLPAYYWSTVGLVASGDVFGWGWFMATKNIIQSSFVTAGPNQLGSYLLPAFFVYLSRIKSTKSYFPIITLILITSAIIFSFSRSAWVGLLAGVIIWLIFFVRDKKVKIIAFSIGGLIIIGGLVLTLNNQHVADLLSHGGQTGHQEAFRITMVELKNRLTEPSKLIFGSGLSTAGPLNLKYNDGIISESWYLELLLEIGVFGTVLWLSLIGIILYNLRRSEPLFLALFSVSICALFLHTFADNPGLAYALFILIGFGVSNGKNFN